MTMGDRIYSLRKKMNLTQGDIARACKVSMTTVHKWEHGVTDNMRADKVQKLAEVLETTIDYLLDGVLEPTLYKNIEPMPQTKMLPILGDIACGEPILAQENYEGLVLEGELAYLKNHRPDFTEDQILFMLSQYADQRDGEDDQAYRKRIISCFVSEVYLWNDRIVIFFNITGPDGKLKSIDLDEFDEFDERLTRSTTSIAGRTLVAALPYGFVLLSNLIQKS